MKAAALLALAVSLSATIGARTADRPLSRGSDRDGRISARYTFHGVAVYTPCDWFTTRLNATPSCSHYAVSTIDPNSGRIINNLNGSLVCRGECRLSINATTPAVKTSGTPANVAFKNTPTYVVRGCAYACSDSIYSDNPKRIIPFSRTFELEGSCNNRTAYYGDCHVVVVTPMSGNPPGTRPGVDYETYQFQPPGGSPLNGSTYAAESLATYNLQRPYHASGSGVTASGLPLLGTQDFGEDASLPLIDHIAYMVLPGSDARPVASGGFVAPATAGSGCMSDCAYALPMGARLRLNSRKYTCPRSSTNPQAHKICIQLETYGMIVMDHGAPDGTFRISIAASSDGSNPWNPKDVDAISTTGGLGNAIPLSDFDVMTLPGNRS